MIRKTAAVFFILIGLISLGNIISRANRIADYKKRGIPIEGKIVSKDTEVVDEGHGRVRNYRTLNTVIVDIRVKGVSGTVGVRETAPIIAGLKTGDSLPLLYLPENLYIAPDGKMVDFIGDNDPVPASFIERTPFTEPIAFVGYGFLAAGVLLLILKPRPV